MAARARPAAAARAEPVSLGVAIASLDEERWIGATLERVLGAQGTDRADQVVVADGGSSDRTREIAQRHGAEVIAAPRGRGSQLAAAAAALDTDVLLFLHADCVPGPGALAAVRDAFARGEVRAGAMRQRIDGRGAFYRAVERCADLRVRWLGIVYGDSALSILREDYASAGGFRALPLFEDVDISRRLRGPLRPRLVRGAFVRVSARRWQREGALRATLRNWILVSAFAFGADPRKLARFYPPERSPGPA